LPSTTPLFFLDNEVAGTGDPARARRLGLRMFQLNSTPIPMLVSRPTRAMAMSCARPILVRMSRITRVTYVNISTSQPSWTHRSISPRDLLLKPLVRFLTGDLAR
jgi:hypothetical protein